MRRGTSGFSYAGGGSIGKIITRAYPYSNYYDRVPFNIERPALPVITREVTILTTGTTAAQDIEDEVKTPGTRVIVPNTAGNIGTLWLHDASNFEIQFGYDVHIEGVLLGRNRSLVNTPVSQCRIIGGRIQFINDFDDGNGNGPHDVVFDSVLIDNDMGAANPSGTIINFGAPSEAAATNRFAFVNSCVKGTITTDTQGPCFYIGNYNRNFLFANCNIVVTGLLNGWGWRMNGGGNWAILDCVFRNAYHKFVRMNTYDVDNVFIEGGVWMREDNSPNDTWTQLGTDMGVTGVTVRNLDVYHELDAEINTGLSSSSTSGSWNMSNIHWHAVSATTVSDTILNNIEASADANASPDYGAGTHTYTYNNPTNFPANPWRDLPLLPERGNPDNIPLL